MEQEFKFEISHENAAALRDLALLRQLQSQPPHEVDLSSEYFDTPDLLLHRAGVSLRVRQDGKRRVQTLKGPARPRAGYFEREEVETVITGTAPQLNDFRKALAPHSCLAAILESPKLSAKLKPAFRVQSRRLVWPLKLAEGDEVELALDHASVHAGEKQQSFCELELELKQGQHSHLLQFALQLLDPLELGMGLHSKSERGYALLGAQSAAAVNAKPLALKQRQSVDDAFLHIIANCLAQIHGNAAGVASGRSPEALHQMRVGLRRLRSALRSFACVLSLPQALQDDLKWLAESLGQSRDREVLAFSTFPKLRVPAGKREDLARAESMVAVQALASREEAAASLRSPRCAHLMLGLELWLAQAPWRGEADCEQASLLQQPVHDFASERLRQSRRKLLKRGRRLQRLQGAQLHKARIAAKQLRYTLEFFSSLFPSGVVKRCRRSLSRLQDTLGEQNDLRVADRLLAQMRGKNHAALCFARGVLAAHTAQAQGVKKSQWRKFKRTARALKRKLKSSTSTSTSTSTSISA